MKQCPDEHKILAMPRLIHLIVGRGRSSCAGLLLLGLALGLPRLEAASETNEPPVANPTVITNLAQFWRVGADPAFRGEYCHARLEVLVYYCDTNWNVYYGRSDDLNTFLPLRNLPVQLKLGELVRFDGLVLPASQQFLWDKTAIQVLSATNQIAAVASQGKLLSPAELQTQFVETEALVEAVEEVSRSLINLKLVAEHTSLKAYVHLEQPLATLPDLAGRVIRIRGVYGATFDPFGKIVNLTLWVAGTNQIQVRGTLQEDPQFLIPLATSSELGRQDTNALIRIAGMVRSQQPGESITVWDDTGQVRVFSPQLQPVQVGQPIEAIGYPVLQGYDRSLRQATFRPMAQPAADRLNIFTNGGKLHLADQVRGLDQDSLNPNPLVSLEGEVTWADARTNLIFIQDSSGGVRVKQSRLDSGKRIQPGMFVTVEGVAAAGEFAPVITNATVRQIGFMSLPVAPEVSFEEALTGTEDGHWIQLRGYVRKATAAGRSLEIQLVAPGGEFTARVPAEDAAQARPGSVVMVRGVCVARANARRQLTAVEIWSSLAGSVQTEQLPPDDLFALPERSIASLRQFNPFNALNRHIHTRGVVTLQLPGRLLYVQDGDTDLLALSSQTDPLQPGDRVEVVGFSGNSGGNFLLREAVYRRLASGLEPIPKDITNEKSLDDDRDGLLVRLQGLLVETANRPGKTRLIVRANGRATDALLEGSAALESVQWLPGSVVAVTGVYRVQRDENGKPIAFFLSLRNPNDVRVLVPPPWWTSRRLALLVVVGLPLFGFALMLAWQTRRKNQQLEHAKVALQDAHDRLEDRVAERTRELHAEADARQHALDRLSEAQARLILASRQAGMAEVATGILHNVGNTLNSVNISTTRIGDFLQRLRIEKFAQAAELLRQQGAQLPEFFKDDPRGRALPGYLQQLAENMVMNEQTLTEETQSLAKQIDHVKAVIAWQQSHASGSSLTENLNPVELMEDALQINHHAYERHSIQVVRQYENPPLITADRHKVLQILINLLTNAKHALAASPAKRVVLRLHPAGIDRVRFEISDTGVGIPPANLERIFSLGFTTRPDGHGFGLHSGANAAKEMHGRLFATSAGTGQGATFILELPIAPCPPAVVSV